jgi:hypothetical protein
VDGAVAVVAIGAAALTPAKSAGLAISREG